MLDNLYSNIGAKIKSWAIWICVIETISAIIGGIILILEEEYLYGLLCLIVGPIVAFVSTWLLYAFGEIAKDISLIRQKYVGDKVIEQKKEQLSKSDIEDAASKHLQRRVSISDINCTLIYVIPKSTGKPKEMHLDMSVGNTEFTSLDLFFDPKRKAYFFQGRQLALDDARRSAEEIFGFDISLFKTFNTDVDEDE